jgi:DNA (cytosine-5)-methyltransferase 1
MGGFHRALASLGGECVLACDIDEKCRDTYEANFGIVPEEDIRELKAEDVPDHDILCGGFPCQSFSSAGHKHAMEDSRGTLFYEIARIVKLKQPKYLLLENVKHIMKIQDGIVFETILKTFEDLGYSMKTVVLSPDMFGVPQHRERVYFMGVLNGDVPELLPIVKEKTVILGKPEKEYKVKPEVDQALSAWDEALPILKEWKSKVPVLIDEFRNTDDLSDYPVWKRRYVEKNKELYSQNPAFWDAWEAKHGEVLSKRKVYRKLEWQVGSIADNDSIWNHFIQLRQSGIRVKKADTFPTLVAIVQTPIYGPEHRHLTPRECARLQSFPEDQILPEKNQVAYKQLGNSVNVNVVTHVASSLLQRTS